MADAITMLPCDPVLGGTAGPMCMAPKSKCTFAQGAGMSFPLMCVAPETTTVGQGAICTRTAAGAGFDNCQPGTYCSGLDNGARAGVATQRECRQYCRTDADCSKLPGSYKCMFFDAVYAPQTGICMPTCTPFVDSTCATGGSDCTASTCTCEVDLNNSSVVSGTMPNYIYQTVCYPVANTVPLGGICTPGDFGQDCGNSQICQFLRVCKTASDCASGDTCSVSVTVGGTPDGGTGTKLTLCANTTACDPLCDATHACPTDPTTGAKAPCQPLNGIAGFPAGLGVCLM